MVSTKIRNFFIDIGQLFLGAILNLYLVSLACIQTVYRTVFKSILWVFNLTKSILVFFLGITLLASPIIILAAVSTLIVRLLP